MHKFIQSIINAIYKISKLVLLGSAAVYVAYGKGEISSAIASKPLPSNNSYPVDYSGGYQASFSIPEENFSTSRILCQISTDYKGKRGAGFGFSTIPNITEILDDGSSKFKGTYFADTVFYNGIKRYAIPSFDTSMLRTRPALLFGSSGCSYHDEECKEKQEDNEASIYRLYLSCK